MVVCAGPHCLPAGGRQPACLALLKNTCAALRRRAVGLFNPSAGRGMQVQELARVQERDMAENIVYEFLPCDYDALVAQGRPTGATKSCAGVKAGTKCEKHLPEERRQGVVLVLPDGAPWRAKAGVRKVLLHRVLCKLRAVGCMLPCATNTFPHAAATSRVCW